MKPWEFEQLQPGEILQLWEGYIWRQEQQENTLAYFTSCQMSVHTKRPVSPKDLLKPIRQPKKRNKKQDEEYLKEQFKLLQE